MNKLGKLIKKSREKKGFSQRQLSKLIGVDNSYVSYLEKGEIKNPSNEIIEELSEELDIDLIEILNALNSKYSFFGVKGTQYINKYSFKLNDERYIDLIKVLQGYKNNEINEGETLGLLSTCAGINLFKYTNPNTRKEFNIENNAEEINKE